MELQSIPVGKLALNKGQIPDVPKNPRFIRDTRYEALKKSISDFPDGLSLRELIVYPHDGKYVILCGNQRFRACKELGYKVMPCKVLDTDTDTATLRRIVILDNQSFGQDDFDILANEFEASELADFGMEMDWLDPDFVTPEPEGKDNDTDTPDPSDDMKVEPMLQICFEDEFDRDRFIASYGDVVKVDYKAKIKIY